MPKARPGYRSLLDKSTLQDWQSSSSVSVAWRAIPATRMLIRNEDAASMIRIRVPSRPLATCQKVLGKPVFFPARHQLDDLESTKVRELEIEILGMNLRIMKVIFLAV